MKVRLLVTMLNTMTVQSCLKADVSIPEGSKPVGDPRDPVNVDEDEDEDKDEDKDKDTEL